MACQALLPHNPDRARQISGIAPQHPASRYEGRQPLSVLIEEAGAEKLQLSITTTRAAMLAFTEHKGLLQHIAKRTADRVLQVFTHRWLLAP